MNQNAGISQRYPAPASFRRIRPYFILPCHPCLRHDADQDDGYCFPWPGHVDDMSGFPAAPRIEFLLAMHAAILTRVSTKTTDG